LDGLIQKTALAIPGLLCLFLLILLGGFFQIFDLLLMRVLACCLICKASGKNAHFGQRRSGRCDEEPIATLMAVNAWIDVSKELISTNLKCVWPYNGIWPTEILYFLLYYHPRDAISGNEIAISFRRHLRHANDLVMDWLPWKRTVTYERKAVESGMCDEE
jgi:hypothetical protein